MDTAFEGKLHTPETISEQLSNFLATNAPLNFVDLIYVFAHDPLYLEQATPPMVLKCINLLLEQQLPQEARNLLKSLKRHPHMESILDAVANGIAFQPVYDAPEQMRILNIFAAYPLIEQAAHEHAAKAGIFAALLKDLPGDGNGYLHSVAVSLKDRKTIVTMDDLRDYATLDILEDWINTPFVDSSMGTLHEGAKIHQHYIPTVVNLMDAAATYVGTPSPKRVVVENELKQIRPLLKPPL